MQFCKLRNMSRSFYFYFCFLCLSEYKNGKFIAVPVYLDIYITSINHTRYIFASLLIVSRLFRRFSKEYSKKENRIGNRKKMHLHNNDVTNLGIFDCR